MSHAPRQTGIQRAVHDYARQRPGIVLNMHEVAHDLGDEFTPQQIGKAFSELAKKSESGINPVQGRGNYMFRPTNPEKRGQRNTALMVGDKLVVVGFTPDGDPQVRDEADTTYVLRAPR